MSVPIRTQILNAIVAQLQTITTGNGYNFSIGDASINFKSFQQIPSDKFPYICLQVGPSKYSPLTQNEYTSGGSKDDLDGWMVGVIGYIKIDHNVGTFVELTEKFHQDIINCMQADPQFSLPSIVINTYLDTIWDPMADAGEQDELYFATVQLIFKIKYDFTKTVS